MTVANPQPRNAPEAGRDARQPTSAPGFWRNYRLVLLGALAYGLGGALCGVLQGSLLDTLSSNRLLQSLVATAGFGVMGLVGGAVLGGVLGGWRVALRWALPGVVGFGVGGLVTLILVFPGSYDLSALPPAFPTNILADPRAFAWAAFMYFLAFGARGALGGALLGLVVPGRHSVRILALLGALGFGLGGILGICVLNLPGINPWSAQPLPLGAVGVCAVWLATVTVPGGALLGAGVRWFTRGKTVS
jgi:hypothetical protein